MNSRQLNILRKASPHLMPRANTCIQAILMANELSDTIRCIRNGSELSTCDTKSFSPNPEAMLRDIRDVCSPAQCELIDMFSNLRKSKDIYNTYKMMNSETFK